MTKSELIRWAQGERLTVPLEPERRWWPSEMELQNAVLDLVKEIGAAWVDGVVDGAKTGYADGWADAATGVN